MEKIAELKQREIDEKKSVLKAAEMIDSSIDDAEKITLINQICKYFFWTSYPLVLSINLLWTWIINVRRRLELGWTTRG